MTHMSGVMLALETASANLYTDIRMGRLLLDYFANNVDGGIQTALVSDLMARYTEVSKQLEEKNKQLSRIDAIRQEAQRIASLGNWELNIAEEAISWSESMYEILETSPSEKPNFELYLRKVHPDDYEMVSQGAKDLLRGIVPKERAYRLIMGSGRIKWVHTRYLLQSDANGSPVSIRGTLQDITEAKLVEERLQEYNDRLEELVQEQVKEISSSQMATIYALVRLAESRDEDTGNHIERTSGYCKLMAEKLREQGTYGNIVDGAFIENIEKASPLHDIGKVGIPDAILLKQGRLTNEEYELMKTHVYIGYETLAGVEKRYPVNGFLRFGMDIARYHHEKWDGSGYLKGLSGEEIPLPARIMAVADVYDALRSKRVYKEAYSHEEAMRVMTQGSGSHFDPVLVDIFLKNHLAFREIFDRLNI